MAGIRTITGMRLMIMDIVMLLGTITTITTTAMTTNMITAATTITTMIMGITATNTTEAR